MKNGRAIEMRMEENGREWTRMTCNEERRQRVKAVTKAVAFHVLILR